MDSFGPTEMVCWSLLADPGQSFFLPQSGVSAIFLKENLYPSFHKLPHLLAPPPPPSLIFPFQLSQPWLLNLLPRNIY